MTDGINPNNLKQARLFFCMISSHEAKEHRHPQIVMKELSEKYHFKIIGCVPQSLFDGWDFWIEFDTFPELPSLFRKVPWKPVGEE